ncbi:hypothetical protein QEG73_09505 [Chitinophagaceae bacterium 26-R-25]|nr:hypothetical protein [Chitinophagaceae bacterium 26-R-25]
MTTRPANTPQNPFAFRADSHGLNKLIYTFSVITPDELKYPMTNEHYKAVK